MRTHDPSAGPARRRSQAVGSPSATSSGAPSIAPSGLVELAVRGGPVPHWMQDLGTRWGAGVRLHVCRRAEGSSRRLLQLLEVNARPDAVADIVHYLKDRARDQDLSITQLGSHRLLVRLVGPLPPLCHSVFEMGAICMSCPFLAPAGEPDAGSTEGHWRVLVHRVRDAQPLLASFTTPGNSPASLVRIGAFRRGPDLTARQELAVGTAFALGYYDYPRRAQLKDVAKALGVGRATAMESLRRGIRKLAAQRQAEGSLVRATRVPGDGDPAA